MTLVMGVLNVTPDSFSDGGRWASTDAAVRHAVDLHSSGADLIDVGGESTRPGADRVSPQVEQDRVLPVITELRRLGIMTSVDTLNSETAERAADAGVDIINDVSGGLADPGMAAVVARTGLTYIAMHWRGHARTMDTLAEYDDVVATVVAELTARVAVLEAAGVARSQIVVDPGLGFSKDAEQNWRVFARLDAFAPLGLPVMVGASRKRFLAGVLPEDATILDRDLPTAVLSVLAAQAGAWAVRVHDVAGTRAALNVLARVDSARIGS
ncbi:MULTISPECIES: dihydropteroate synthase [unclassified Cryobacterium]|uniref:dihydropteroate synthase n=1 Tax=unclassified Cryobacterium TaxID=2649013 RepID=UPI0010693D32|nr:MULTISPECIES: dihydropteroate synthase [unclassified Cryobacterium]TFC52699.1 dihydropteroate synthase [Cryobacterium sp. TMB3-1-2]TFC68355.1 dihydropteroate synthase [Cryobacterium sp. TMB3-15]TFC74945.1 dihydropteroate synthase [Cryobacterium sp. TMB3-10]TFC92845.1 dihydropteroate synthase [Cryobacterium sp. TMT4-31]TFD38395.1 dihydropteroate synthase [Cryobacterium sp. TMB3-12]